MMPLGTQAPSFSLTDTDGANVSLDSFAGKKALLVIFMCNHCPYVKHVADGIKSVTDDAISRDVGVVAISSNDKDEYPDDSPEAMAKEKVDRGYGFSYCYDADQSVAQAYSAACTPDFFLFDGDHKLVYRGTTRFEPPQDRHSRHRRRFTSGNRRGTKWTGS